MPSASSPSLPRKLFGIPSGSSKGSMKLGLALLVRWLSLASLAPTGASANTDLRCLMYLTGQHPVIPPPEEVRHVTHVALAFLSASIFHEPARTEWPLFMTVDEVRSRFPAGTRVLVAIGGWGDTHDFSAAAKSETSRKAFAANVARMVQQTGADGADMDWEFPGGNGDDYKSVPNSAKAWEVAAYPLLLAELRAALGPTRILSAAVPGLPRDMLAFTRETVPRIMRHLDFLNVMTYDLMNRRDAETKHHTGIRQSIEALDAYVANGAAPQKLNLGLAFYAKYFRTEHDACAMPATPLGCPTLLLEDPNTGADLGLAGAFSWHDPVPQEVASSFTRALEGGAYDEHHGGYSYWDGQGDLWWTFDTPDAVVRKVSHALDKTNVGGFFAWGLGEDAPVFEHLHALNRALEGQGADKDEL